MYDFGQNNQWGLGTNSFNFGGGAPVGAVPYGSLNTYGMASPTLGGGPLGGATGALGNGAGSFGGLGLNMPTLQLGLGAIGSLANLWGGFQAQKLARDQFDFTKGITNTNLNNSIKSYNTALEDRARARGAAEGQTADQIASYVDRNRISR
ncbi:hypothetical protein [Burkholderia phage vB_BpP_HN02]|uniref:Uncharacterized protein n=1 Tax=Burkholderia phage vB_BpP_HN02 TaxID=3116925 RepID=A0AAX4JHX6_9CAUD